MITRQRLTSHIFIYHAINLAIALRSCLSLAPCCLCSPAHCPRSEVGHQDPGAKTLNHFLDDLYFPIFIKCYEATQCGHWFMLCCERLCILAYGTTRGVEPHLSLGVILSALSIRFFAIPFSSVHPCDRLNQSPRCPATKKVMRFREAELQNPEQTPKYSRYS